MLIAEQAGQYPRGAAAAILLSLQYVSAGEDGRSCGAVMDLLAVLSAAGVRRSLIHAVARKGLAGARRRWLGCRRRWWTGCWDGWPGPHC